MNVTREVILDLLPVYLSGEASPATRALVEEYCKNDPELGQRLRVQWAEGLKQIAPSGLPPELELKSLKRTRAMLARQRWLFGFSLFFSALGLSFEFSTRNGHLYEAHFLFQDYLIPFGLFALLAVPCWILYFLVRHRIRTAGF